MNPEALIGMELGQSVIRRLLGQGTMGTVYLADQVQVARQVAIKVFLSTSLLEASVQQEFLHRLHAEITLSASLEHPSILPILAYGTEQDLLYMVMPLVTGERLQSLLDRSPSLPFEQIQRYLEQLTSALDYAHGRAILHRDLKPANIFLTQEGQLLLSDFALAGLTTEKNYALVRQPAPGMLNYIAPEYVLGKKIDQRADLYSLGALLYHMVTGKAPFNGTSLSDTAMKQVKGIPISPCSLRKDLPQAAEQVILRALAKRPADRYARAQDMASAFRLALEAAQLLPATTPASAPEELASVATENDAGGITARMARLPSKSRNSLFNPKWQTITASASPFSSDAETRHVPPTPVLSPLPETTTMLGEQPQYSFSDTSEANALSAGVIPPDQSPKRTNFLSFADFSTNSPNPAEHVDDILQAGNQPPNNTEEMKKTEAQPERQTTTGLLNAFSMVAHNGENTGTIKLTEPVKVIKMEIPGQPGRYMTGLLPALSPAIQTGQLTQETTGHSLNYVKLISICAAILIVALGSGMFLWSTLNHTASTHSKMLQTMASLTATAPVATPLDPNVILTDNLNQNIHDWPVGSQGSFAYAFTGGTYHITNHDKNKSAPAILPGKTIQGAFAYSLTMEQIQGDQTSLNNLFGMIFDATIQTTGNKQIAHFYTFEVLNSAKGEYQFWKYDNSKSASTPWTSLWKQNLGKEFLQGTGSTHINTVKIKTDSKTFTFLINGKQVGTFKDSAFSSGSVGMLVNLNGSEVAFSNLQLTHA